MTTKTKRTAVYIDGYNLYYGRLRGTPHKWLDLVALFRKLVTVQDPDSEVVSVQFFTANALARFATHGAASEQAQSAYHRAMETLYPDCFRITRGSHSVDRSGTLLPTYVEGQPYDRNLRSRVWKIEEKQTDVNLALAMYRDAMKGLFDHVVLCSNDQDAEPALVALKEDFPSIMRGVVSPVRPPEAPDAHRRLSGSLMAHAHWTRRYLLDEELAAAHLPEIVPTKKKPIRKPTHW